MTILAVLGYIGAVISLLVGIAIILLGPTMLASLKTAISAGQARLL